MNLYDYAIKMEQDGARYYNEQAEKNKKHAIGRVFSFLAQSEERHAILLQERVKNQKIDLNELKVQSDEANIFTAIDEFKADVTSIPRQLDVYEMALDMEQKSIDLYCGMLEKATSEADQKFLQFLIDQEKQHHMLFDTLLTLVRRPEEWVEDAEFGPREDY